MRSSESKAGWTVRKYTSEDDEKILACDTGAALKALAERLGRTCAALQARRSFLRGKTKSHGYTVKLQVPLRRPPPALAARIARPEWFDEDVEQLARVRRMA